VGRHVLIGHHTHPGPESGYLLEGEFVLMLDGQPPQPLKAGESYRIPSGAIHDAKSGAGGAKVWQCISCAKASRWRKRFEVWA